MVMAERMLPLLVTYFKWLHMASNILWFLMYQSFFFQIFISKLRLINKKEYPRPVVTKRASKTCQESEVCLFNRIEIYFIFLLSVYLQFRPLYSTNTTRSIAPSSTRSETKFSLLELISTCVLDWFENFVQALFVSLWALALHRCIKLVYKVDCLLQHHFFASRFGKQFVYLQNGAYASLWWTSNFLY